MAAIYLLDISLAASSSTAQQVISYQGAVSNNGTPLQGPHNVMLAIYTASTGGTAIYQESMNGILFTDGIFSVLMGSNQANPLPVFDAGDYTGKERPAPEYFLGISIDGKAELTPRSRFGAAPTA